MVYSIDFAASYDSCPRQKIIQAFHDAGINPYITKVMSNLFNIAKITIDGETFRTNIGLLSPMIEDNVEACD